MGIVKTKLMWVDVYKTKSMTSSFCKACLRNIFCRFGVVKVLVTVNGTQFTSEESNMFTELNGIRHILTPPGHPATNGEKSCEFC